MHLLWAKLCERAGLAFDLTQQQRLEQYLDLLLQANQRINMTAIRDRIPAESMHVGDALTLLPLLPNKPHRLADVGSGGGIPGMILAIMRPDILVTLIESTKKKADFLKSAAATLGLNNVDIKADRAEDLGLGPARESFDVVVARAVAAMELLAEWMLPLACVGGIALAMKGPKVQTELPQAAGTIKLMGGGVPEVLPAHSPAGDNLVIVKISKIVRTQSQYPRSSTSGRR